MKSKLKEITKEQWLKIGLLVALPSPIALGLLIGWGIKKLIGERNEFEGKSRASGDFVGSRKEAGEYKNVNKRTGTSEPLDRTE